MTRDQIEIMILDIIGRVDYDIAKSFDPELSEDPERSEQLLRELIDVCEDHIQRATKATKGKRKK